MESYIPGWNAAISKKIRGRILYFQHPDGSSVTLILSRGRYWTISKEIQEEAFFLKTPEEGRFIEIEYTTGGYRWHAIASSRQTEHHFKKHDAPAGTNRHSRKR